MTYQLLSQSNSRIRAVQYIFCVFTFNCALNVVFFATIHIDAIIAVDSVVEYARNDKNRPYFSSQYNYIQTIDFVQNNIKLNSNRISIFFTKFSEST